VVLVRSGGEAVLAMTTADPDGTKMAIRAGTSFVRWSADAELTCGHSVDRGRVAVSRVVATLAELLEASQQQQQQQRQQQQQPQQQHSRRGSGARRLADWPWRELMPELARYRHATRVVQRAWRRAVADPERALCRARLRREHAALVL
jgi:hypothetical protein